MASQKQIDYAAAVQPNLLTAIDRAEAVINAMAVPAGYEAEKAAVMDRLARIRALASSDDAALVLDIAEGCFHEARWVAKGISDRNLNDFIRNLSSSEWRVRLAGHVERAERRGA